MMNVVIFSVKQDFQKDFEQLFSKLEGNQTHFAVRLRDYSCISFKYLLPRLWMEVSGYFTEADNSIGPYSPLLVPKYTPGI